MSYKYEPSFDHQPLRQQCTDNQEAFACLALRQMDVTRMLQCYAGAGLVLLVVSLLGLGALSSVALVFAVACAFMAVWAAIAHEKYDGLLHLTALHDRIRPEATGEDWLAYHLAERMRQEEQGAKSWADVIAAAEAALRAAEAEAPSKQAH